MLQWLKRSLASFLGDKKDVVKNLPLIKKLNEKANIELDSKRSILLEENFEILGCSNNDSFETVRDSYLALAKIYHPDRHSSKSESIKNEYNAKIKKIQAAYEGLKPFFKNQENFIKVG